jgi:hypothetical protein
MSGMYGSFVETLRPNCGRAADGFIVEARCEGSSTMLAQSRLGKASKWLLNPGTVRLG